MIGTVIKHRYELIEKIGEGNLFSVYKCEDKIENRLVAMKILLPQYSADRMFAERLLVEAKAMVGVAHPGIVEVYDCGEQEGIYFVIVEYVRGVDLRERIRRSAPFTPSTAVDAGMAICEVIDFAHKHGFVHGDLRPGNILVTPEGHIKIADFWVGGAIASSQTLSANAIMRSIHYMAPEVAEGKTPAQASDIYSVGIILFELLVGVVPFDGDTPIAIGLQHARAPIPSVRSLNPGVPRNLESSVAKALQKAPESRYRSAKAMLNDLKSAREGLRTSKSGPPDQQAAIPDISEASVLSETEPALLAALRRTLLAIVLIVAVVSALLIGYVWMRPGEITVPDMLGKTLTEAQQVANANHFQIAVKSEQFNDDYSEGTVYYMNPAGGRSIKAGKVVDVWISKGSRYATVPNCLRLTTENARERIAAAGLNVGEISQEYSSAIAAGSISKQVPSAGKKTERGQPVNLVISLGPDPTVEIPADSAGSAQSGPAQSFDVKFTVPKGRDPQPVRIIVLDDNGENVVYSELLHPGDKVNQTVQGTGKEITIRVYIADKLVREEHSR